MHTPLRLTWSSFAGAEESRSVCERAPCPSVSAGCWQPAGWVSAGQLWHLPGPDHRRLSERPAQGSDWRGGDLQRWAHGQAACGRVLC